MWASSTEEVWGKCHICWLPFRRNLLCSDKIWVACVEKVAFECSSRVERT